MKISITDDWSDALRKLSCFAKLDGLDVTIFSDHKTEIVWSDDKIACHPRVIATPHIGFVTRDELEIQFSKIFDQVIAWYNKAPINIVNPTVWHSSYNDT